jgi:hypothetical protein
MIVTATSTVPLAIVFRRIDFITNLPFDTPLRIVTELLRPRKAAVCVFGGRPFHPHRCRPGCTAARSGAVLIRDLVRQGQLTLQTNEVPHLRRTASRCTACGTTSLMKGQRRTYLGFGLATTIFASSGSGAIANPISAHIFNIATFSRSTCPDT